MNFERRTLIDRVYRDASNRPPADRTTWLARECAGDADLLREVQARLARDLSRGAAEETVAAANSSDAELQRAHGRDFGSYEVDALIGEGGMGRVYRARDVRLGRAVALKVLPSVFASDPDRLARFRREAQFLASLNHPNVCQIYDVGDDYLVLEYVEGRPLHGVFTVREALRVAVQVASALEAAHRRGILHRDLKPANILLTDGGTQTGELPTVKVLDFGVAKMLNAESAAMQTVDGVVIGTPAYMAPEQAEGRPLDVRSDVFAFGAVLYEMLAGTRAFRGETAAQILTSVLRDEPVPLATAPPALEQIVFRCLRKQPADRFQSIAEVKAALERITVDPPQSEPSIAVLPFANMSGDKEKEYFTDGLAEEIINALAQIPGLKVTARTSAFAFRGKEQDITTIADALRVRTVLEGSVRWSGNRVRVTAQLIEAAGGYHLWSDRFDRELSDAFAIQDEIAQAIARTLQVKLSPMGTPRRYVPHPAAYEAYLKARHHLGTGQLLEESLDRARVLIDQAIALDPGFALARQQRSNYFLLQATWVSRPAHEMMPKSRSAALDALARDPDLPEAHASLGVVAGLYDYDRAEQERRFAAAMARDPVSPDVRASYGMYYLLPTGRAAEGAKALKRALEEDPLNALTRVHYAICLDASGEVVEAERELRHVLDLNDRFGPAAEWLSLHCAFRGRLEEAAGFAEQTLAIAGRKVRFVGLFAGILKRIGAQNQADALLKTIGTGEAQGAPTELMIFHLLQSDAKEAANWAEKAVAQRDPYFAVLMATLVGDAIRATPEWPRIARLMNQPAQR